ncbi:hypothetical protein [Pararhizobium sp. IMCC21322]|uniref:hypothetical protein n=1 Tax=Pararhizobium sp. IMCC21322 TaxID=3067903 RepID=UPI00274134EB|nr:hypothetical protein [Pararhizobium sp. IMCC21322]
MAVSEDMHRVAHHLQQRAVAVSPKERDSFARSAYNRYYYSVFLQAREMMREINPAWSSLPHADYPKTLSGKIRKDFINERKKAVKREDGELVKVIDHACRSIAELKKIIVAANATRVVADYEPEEGVEFLAEGRFSLRSIDVTDAHAWTTKVETHCRTVSRAWKQLNV